MPDNDNKNIKSLNSEYLNSNILLSANDVNILLNEIMKTYRSDWEIKFIEGNFILLGSVKKLLTFKLKITVEIVGYENGIIFFNCKSIKSDKLDYMVNKLVNILKELIAKNLPDTVKLNYPKGSIAIKDIVFNGNRVFDKNISIENILTENEGIKINFKLTNLDFLKAKSNKSQK